MAVACPKGGLQQTDGSRCERCGFLLARYEPSAAMATDIRPSIRRSTAPTEPRISPSGTPAVGAFRRVYRVFRWVALAVLLTASAATASAAASASPVQPGHRTFLWSVSSSSATVHLFGSVHVASPAVYPLDSRIESAFDGADTLVLEMALDPATQVQLGQKLASAGTYPAGDTIDLHLNRESLQLLQQRLSQSGAPFSSIRSFRPWFVAMLFTLSGLQRLGYRPDLGIDVYFADKARSRKRILGLETSDEQVALFAGMTEAAQEQMLKEALARLDELGEYMERALRFWRLGDTKAVDGLLVAPIRKDYPDMYQKIFADRNRKMADAVEGYLKRTGVYFVVIGSGHLTGPDGVLEMLQGKGYVAIQK